MTNINRDKKPRLLGERSGKSRQNLAILTMVLPGAVWLILLRYLPMFGIPIAFKTFQGPDAFYQRTHTYLEDIFVNPNSKWSLSNYEALLENPTTWNAVRNTLLYNLFYITVGTLIAVAFAIMLNEITRKFVAKAYQTLMFFPYFLSWVVASYFFMAFLQDVKGVLDTPDINFYTNPGPWPVIIIISFIWKMTGYSTVLYLSAITSIDSTQYEAASIDGATKWQQVLHICLPVISFMTSDEMVSKFGAMAITALSNGTLEEAHESELVTQARIILAGATDTNAAVQDSMDGDARTFMFESIRSSIVTGNRTAEDVLREVIGIKS